LVLGHQFPAISIHHWSKRTEIHDVVTTDGAVVDDNVPGPESDCVPLAKPSDVGVSITDLASPVAFPMEIFKARVPSASPELIPPRKVLGPAWSSKIVLPLSSTRDQKQGHTHKRTFLTWNLLAASDAGVSTSIPPDMVPVAVKRA
jgi:hypothetical protein